MMVQPYQGALLLKTTNLAKSIGVWPDYFPDTEFSSSSASAGNQSLFRQNEPLSVNTGGSRPVPGYRMTIESYMANNVNAFPQNQSLFSLINYTNPAAITSSPTPLTLHSPDPTQQVTMVIMNSTQMILIRSSQNGTANTLFLMPTLVTYDPTNPNTTMIETMFFVGPTHVVPNTLFPSKVQLFKINDTNAIILYSVVNSIGSGPYTYNYTLHACPITLTGNVIAAGIPFTMGTGSGISSNAFNGVLSYYQLTSSNYIVSTANMNNITFPTPVTLSKYLVLTPSGLTSSNNFPFIVTTNLITLVTVGGPSVIAKNGTQFVRFDTLGNSTVTPNSVTLTLFGITSTTLTQLAQATLTNVFLPLSAGQLLLAMAIAVYNNYGAIFYRNATSGVSKVLFEIRSDNTLVLQPPVVVAGFLNPLAATFVANYITPYQIALEGLPQEGPANYPNEVIVVRGLNNTP